MDFSIICNIKNWKQAKCLSKWLPSLGAPLCHSAVWPGLEGEDKDGEDTPALEPSWEVTQLNEASLPSTALGPARSETVAWTVRERIAACPLLRPPPQPGRLRSLRLSSPLLILEVSKQAGRLKTNSQTSDTTLFQIVSFYSPSILADVTWKIKRGMRKGMWPDAGVGNLGPTLQTWSAACFAAHYKRRTKFIQMRVFRFLKIGRKSVGTIYGVWKLSAVQMSGSINQVSLERSHAHSSTHCPQPFLCTFVIFRSRWQIWEVPKVPRETQDDPQSPKYFLICPFTEVCWLLVKRFGNSLLNKVTPTVLCCWASPLW